MRGEKGQAAVELALSLTVVILLLCALVDFGRICYAKLALSHAGREAARVASVGGSDSSVVSTGRNAGVGLDTGKITVSVSPSTRNRGTYATVKLNYPVEIVTPLMANILSNPFPVSTQTIMRVE